MTLRLKNPNAQFPPGGWPFKDERTGFKVGEYEGTPEMQAEKVIKNRRANPHLYPAAEGHWFSRDAVVQEIYRNKFKTHAYLFAGRPDKTASSVLSPPRKQIEQAASICACGANYFEPVYCPTCSGKRIKSYKCRKCGATKAK